MGQRLLPTRCLGFFYLSRHSLLADSALCGQHVFPAVCGFSLASAGIAPAGIDSSTVSWAGALWNWSASVPGNIVGGALLSVWLIGSLTIKKNRYFALGY